MRTLAMSGTLSLSILPTSSSNLHLPLSTIRISDPAFSIALPVKVRNPNLGYSSKILNSPSSNAAANNYDNNDNIDGHSSVESANPYFFSSTDTFKMPTAPWMKGLPFLEPDQVKALSKPKHRKNSHIDENGKPGPSLTDRISGGRGKKAMKMIIQSVENLQAVDSSEETYRREMEFEFDTSLEQFWGDRDSKIGRKVPWLKDERLVFRRTKKEKVATAAELSLDGTLLERLRREAGRMRKWVKVNKAGVTPSVVDQIRFIWKNNELAMLQLDIPLCRNMDRAREIVEMKTGGLVVWCRKDKLVIYRGSNYRLTSNYITEMHPCSPRGQGASSLNGSWHVSEDTVASSQGKSNEGAESEKISGIKGYEENIQVHKSLFEREADRLLGGLGPRFIDWWRPKPLPVDADLLPEVVPGFRPPFRLCPPHTRPKLNDDELTYLRKLARPLPTHFVLGRNRKLQGLAVAILKLWERCHIAKIAVKLGIPNTNNEQMAYELKEIC